MEEIERFITKEMTMPEWFRIKMPWYDSYLEEQALLGYQILSTADAERSTNLFSREALLSLGAEQAGEVMGGLVGGAMGGGVGKCGNRIFDCMKLIIQ